MSAICWTLLPKKKNLWKSLPRERVAGIILGVVCLWWSAAHAYPLLEGGLAKLRVFIAPLLVVISVLSYFLLDYLFTRALGGFVLLTVNWLLHEAFAAHIPLRHTFSAICYLLGIFAIVIIATPYHFRDLLDKITNVPRWRLATASILGISGSVLLFISIINHVR